MISTWIKGSALLAATLTAGIAIGVMSERARGHHEEGATEMHSEAKATHNHLQMAHEHFLQTLHHTLRLDSSQRRAITEALNRQQSHVDSAWGAMRPHFNATLDSTHREIMSLLRPEQREAFERMIGRHHR